MAVPPKNDISETDIPAPLPRSSGGRFRNYLANLPWRKAKSGDAADSGKGKSPGKSPGKNAPRARTAWELLAQFWKLLKPERGLVLFAMGTVTVSTLLRLYSPWAVKITVDSVLPKAPFDSWWPSWLAMPGSHMELLVWLAGSVVLVSIIAAFVHFWGRWYATLATNRMQISIRRRVFEHVVRLPLSKIHSMKAGGTASNLREDGGGVSELVFNLLYNPWQAIVQLVGSLFFLILVDWRLMLGGATLIPIVYLTHRTWISRVRPLYRGVRSRREEIDSHTVETFGGMRIVRAFDRQRSESGRFVRDNQLLVRQQLYTWWWARWIEIGWEILIPIASACLLLYGGWQVLYGDLTPGDLVMFLMYLAMLLGPLSTLASSATSFQNNLSALDRVLDLLEEPEEFPAPENALSLDQHAVAGNLTLQSVGFQYPETETWVLRDINLDIEAGQTVALVGRSGAGKTTLCNLLARFYDPTTGSIQLDGEDLRNYKVDDFRKLIGIVEQDVFLFDGSIAENIAYGRRGATEAEVIAAARAAHAAEFIERFDHGYDTLIGERGVKLSGGQRQRLAIARAIVADPKILILDEATSNLDSESERAIQDSLKVLLEGRTCVVIAHRLSTIADADQIVVLEHGEVLDVGTHDELLARGGKYREMVDLQLNLSQPLEG